MQWVGIKTLLMLNNCGDKLKSGQDPTTKGCGAIDR
jgi:hypothetical protein